jgi:Fe2+ or Zn2+ uptake regulation protein
MATDVLDTQLADLLRARGQRVTPQRLVIHRVLRERDQHVTADEVLAAVDDVLPGVSLPTIYATLELFEEVGVVRRVASGGGAAVYDTRVGEHHHLVCRRCGGVWDVDAEVGIAPALAGAAAVGFATTHASLTLSGVCADCAAAAVA